MPLDPQAREFLDRLARSQAPPMHRLRPEDARALVVPLRMPKEPMGGIDNRMIPGPAGQVPIRVYVPSQPAGQGDEAIGRSGNDGSRGIASSPPPDNSRPALPIVVFFHGGGWVLGSISSHDALCRRLCHASGCIVVSVDYRLAPEHKFPAAVDDCFAATEWVATHAGELGGDATRLAVAGDSAGGNLAAVVALLSRDRRGPKLAFQMLIYPITDYLPDTPSYHRNGSDYFLTTETIAWFWDHYLNTASEGSHWTASPLRAANLAGLPPALVMVAEFDPLLDEGLRYAERLEQSGVPVERRVCAGQIHGFLRRLDTFDQAVATANSLGQALRRALTAC